MFTIQPNGATLDASGSGAVNFTNGGAIVSADAPATAGASDATGGGSAPTGGG